MWTIVKTAAFGNPHPLVTSDAAPLHLCSKIMKVAQFHESGDQSASICLIRSF
jgi:hypothetical protein